MIEDDHFLWGVPESRTGLSQDAHGDCTVHITDEGKLSALIRIWIPINSSAPSKQNTAHTCVVISEH